MNHKPQLLYFGDPMCSWCYGFAPEISKAKEELGDQVELKMVMGGLRPYNTETMEKLGSFLKKHWHHVAEASGQAFNYDLLEDYSFVYDTEPPCRAVVTMEQIQPHKTFDFYKAIQSAFYAENQNTNLTATYLPLVSQLGISPEDFKQAYESEEMKKAVRGHFMYSADLGIRGFPTVVLKIGEQLKLISNGYTKATNLVQKCKAHLEET